MTTPIGLVPPLMLQRPAIDSDYPRVRGIPSVHLLMFTSYISEKHLKGNRYFFRAFLGVLCSHIPGSHIQTSAPIMVLLYLHLVVPDTQGTNDIGR